MSVTKLPREQGIWIKCDGTTSDPHPAAVFKHCPEKIFTANVFVRVNRANAANEGWGRGLRKDRKRSDHCPNCLSNEQQIEVNRKVESEARKAKRDEEHRAAKAAEKAARAAAAPPKKSRKPKAAQSSAPSPSVDSAPAPA
ncbi:MAG TPA: hypothetical protein VIV58_30510 [Kofleriaceae bacterium]